MKKNDVFTFTVPNGAEVTAVVLKVITMSECERTEDSETWTTIYLCYAQNRIFLLNVWKRVEHVINDNCPDEDSIDYYYALKYYSHDVETTGYHQEIIVDYAILPDYDNMLELHQTMDYPIWEQNMEKPDPDEGEDIFWDSCAEEHNKQEDV